MTGEAVTGTDHTGPIEIPANVAELGQAIPTLAASLAIETARPTVANLEGMAGIVAALQGSLNVVAEWINEVRRSPNLAPFAKFLLWGFHPDHRDGELAILAGGDFVACEREQEIRSWEGGWTMSILPGGQDPDRIRAKAEAARMDREER
jgi:hypothetical protein